MLTDALPCKANRAEFLESDRIKTLDLPQDVRLLAIAKSIESAMEPAKSAGVRSACVDFLTSTSEFYKVPFCGIRVLAARPTKLPVWRKSVCPRAFVAKAISPALFTVWSVLHRPTFRDLSPKRSDREPRLHRRSVYQLSLQVFVLRVMQMDFEGLHRSILILSLCIPP
jgi:hypothetical protein